MTTIAHYARYIAACVVFFVAWSINNQAAFKLSDVKINIGQYNCNKAAQYVVHHTWGSQWKLGWSHVFNPKLADKAEVLWVYTPSEEFLDSLSRNPESQKNFSIVAEPKEKDFGVVLDNEKMDHDLVNTYKELSKDDQHAWDIYIASAKKRFGDYQFEFGIIDWTAAPKWKSTFSDPEKLANNFTDSLCFGDTK